MQCFNCGTTVVQRKSEYGFYYKCPKCGNTFETQGQNKNNNVWFSRARNTNVKK